MQTVTGAGRDTRPEPSGSSSADLVQESMSAVNWAMEPVDRLRRSIDPELLRLAPAGARTLFDKTAEFASDAGTVSREGLLASKRCVTFLSDAASENLYRWCRQGRELTFTWHDTLTVMESWRGSIAVMEHALLLVSRGSRSPDLSARTKIARELLIKRFVEALPAELCKKHLPPSMNLPILGKARRMQMFDALLNQKNSLEALSQALVVEGLIMDSQPDADVRFCPVPADPYGTVAARPVVWNVKDAVIGLATGPMKLRGRGYSLGDRAFALSHTPIRREPLLLIEQPVASSETALKIVLRPGDLQAELIRKITEILEQRGVDADAARRGQDDVGPGNVTFLIRREPQKS